MRTVRFIVLALLVVPASASAQLVVDPQVLRYDLQTNIALFEDETGVLSVDQARQRRFVPLQTRFVTEGLSASAFWVRVRLQNDTPHAQERFLEIGRNTIDHVEVHFPDGSSRDSARIRPYSERAIPTRNHVLPVSLPPSSETTLYVRIRSQSEVVFPIRLWTPAAFHEHDREEHIILGASYGAMLLLALYHFVLFIRLRERHLFYFGSYVLLIGFWLWLTDGLGYQTLDWILPALGHYPYATTAFAGAACAVLFTRSFLETKQRSPKMHRMLGAIMIAMAVLIGLQAFVDHRTINALSPPLWVVCHVTLLIAGVNAWRAGMKAAGWFAAAWSFYVLVGLYAAFAVNGFVAWLPFDVNQPFRFGVLADVLFISFALADRLDTLAKERAEARAFATAQAQLAEGQKSAVLGRLMAGILHEMNSPLGALSSASGSLAKTLDRLDRELPDDAEKLRRYLGIGQELSQTMGASSERISEVVESLRRFTAVDEDAEKRVDVRQGLDGALTLLAPDNGDRVTIVRRYPDEPAMALCKPAPLNHALLELLRRAVEASVDGTVSVEVDVDEVVTIEIKDDGPAVPGSELATLFELGFSEVDGKMRMRLALPLAMQAIKGMNGTLEMRSDEGGTTSIVTLPL